MSLCVHQGCLTRGGSCFWCVYEVLRATSYGHMGVYIRINVPILNTVCSFCREMKCALWEYFWECQLQGKLCSSCSCVRVPSTMSQGHTPAPPTPRCGSCDSHLTSLVALHIRSLLPPASADMDIPHNIEMACLVSLGLLHMASGSRHLVDTTLREIGGHVHV